MAGSSTVAELFIETEAPIQMTCDNTVAIPKGSLLQITSPFTVSKTSGVDQKYGGIAAEEKIANNGKVKIAVYRGGYFVCECGTNSVTVGLPVVMDDAANELTDAAAGDAELGLIFGSAMESATVGQFFILHLGHM